MTNCPSTMIWGRISHPNKCESSCNFIASSRLNSDWIHTLHTKCWRFDWFLVFDAPPNDDQTKDKTEHSHTHLRNHKKNSTRAKTTFKTYSCVVVDIIYVSVSECDVRLTKKKKKNVLFCLLNYAERFSMITASSFTLKYVSVVGSGDGGGGGATATAVYCTDWLQKMSTTTTTKKKSAPLKVRDSAALVREPTKNEADNAMVDRKHPTNYVTMMKCIVFDRWKLKMLASARENRSKNKQRNQKKNFIWNDD